MSERFMTKEEVMLKGLCRGVVQLPGSTEVEISAVMLRISP